MKKVIKIVGFVLLILLFFYLNNFSDEKSILDKKIEKVHFCQQFIDAGKYYKVWSDSNPAINKTHIFCGEYNNRGKPVGFHSMPNGIMPPTIKIYKTENKDKFGVYNAKFNIAPLGRGLGNLTKFSSIFPDELSQEEVEKAILNAWKNKKYYKNSKFSGPSGLGFEISGYTYKGKNKINTAYPIYKK